MQKLVFENSNGDRIDFTDGTNFGIVSWSGLSECSQEIQTQKVPFVDGSVFLDNILNERTLEFTLALNDEKDLKKRYKLKRTLITIMNVKLGQGKLIYKNDILEKQITVVPELPIFPTKNFDEAGTMKVSLTFTACSPYWEDVYSEIENINEGTTLNSKMIFNKSDVAVTPSFNFTGNGNTIKIENKKNKNYIQIETESGKTYSLDTMTGKKRAVSYTTEHKSVELNYLAHYSYELDRTLVIGHTYVDGNYLQQKYFWAINNGFDCGSHGNYLAFNDDFDKPYVKQNFAVAVGKDFWFVLGQELFKNGVYQKTVQNYGTFIKLKNKWYITETNTKLVEVGGDDVINLATPLGQETQIVNANGGFVELNDNYINIYDENLNVKKVTHGITFLERMDLFYAEKLGALIVRDLQYNYISTDFEHFSKLGIENSMVNFRYPACKTIKYLPELDVYCIIGVHEIDDVEVNGKVFTKDFYHFFVYNSVMSPTIKNMATSMTYKDNQIVFGSTFEENNASLYPQELVQIDEVNEIENVKSQLSFNLENGGNMIECDVPVSVIFRNKFLGV